MEFTNRAVLSSSFSHRLWAPRSCGGKEFPAEVDPRPGRLGINLARPPPPIPRGVKWGADPCGRRPVPAPMLRDLLWRHLPRAAWAPPRPALPPPRLDEEAGKLHGRVSHHRRRGQEEIAMAHRDLPLTAGFTSRSRGRGSHRPGS